MGETHGHTRKGWSSGTYKAWQAIRGRYPTLVCGRWNSFTTFLSDMGERPDGTLLTRVDRTRPYEPGNVEWAPPGTKYRESREQRKRHHGHTWKGGHSPTYGSWQSMIQRCTNPDHDSYPKYGGKGITVCESWADFRNFLSDMGERPPGTTLDRLDNDRGYEPGNVRWGTPVQQANNKTVVGTRRCSVGCTCGRHRPTVHSPETLAKISATKTGRTCPPGCTCGRHRS